MWSSLPHLADSFQCASCRALIFEATWSRFSRWMAFFGCTRAFMYFFACSALPLMYPCNFKLRRATSCKIRSHSQSGAVMTFVQACFTAIQNAKRAISKINPLVFVLIHFFFFYFLYSLSELKSQARPTNLRPAQGASAALKRWVCMPLATRELCQPPAGGEPEQLRLHLGVCWLLLMG